jgi:hypothetical protein
MKEIPHGSESFRKLNPHLYGVGGLEANEPEPTTTQALENDLRELTFSKNCVVVCTLVAHRKRLLDDDNCVGSLKPLRDGISQSLGVDDGDKGFRWQYGQVQTKGRQGVVVTIERV